MEQDENPLVPNEKLRQMYRAMAEARVLDEHIAKLQRRVKGRRRLDSIRGQEACRVSTAIDLGPGDLVSDSQVGVVMDLLAGEKVSSLLTRVAGLHSGKKEQEGEGSGDLREAAVDRRCGGAVEDGDGCGALLQDFGAGECCGRLCAGR